MSSIGSFLWDKTTGTWSWPHDSIKFSTLRTSGAIPSLPHMSSWNSHGRPHQKEMTRKKSQRISGCSIVTFIECLRKHKITLAVVPTEIQPLISSIHCTVEQLYRHFHWVSEETQNNLSCCPDWDPTADILDTLYSTATWQSFETGTFWMHAIKVK